MGLIFSWPTAQHSLEQNSCIEHKNGAQSGKGKQLSNWGNIRRYVRYYKHLYWYVFRISSVGMCNVSFGLSQQNIFFLPQLSQLAMVTLEEAGVFEFE